jgi:hypothetical protein
VIRVSFSARIVGAILAVTALSTMTGCIATRLKAASCRGVESGMEVIVHSAAERRMMETIGLFSFDAPAQTAGVSEKVTAAFEAQMVRRSPFREVRQMGHPVKSDAEALWYGRNQGCDMVMVPAVIYVMDGSGALPTRLETRTRILDARTGMVLWDIKQIALSEPGADIDLTWNTIAGQPAQRYPELADMLARNFADFLTQPEAENTNRSSRVLTRQ